MSSSGDNYGTPIDLYKQLNERFHFKLDPCAWPENRLNIPNWYIEKDNGLTMPWYPGSVFMNPPYSDPGPWCKKAYKESLDGVLTVGLLRHDPSTRWWNTWVHNRAEVIAVPYRLKFVSFASGKPEGSYNFPSALVIWHGLWV